jgi:hypothetical protein
LSSNPTTASFLRVEAGLAAVGNLLLEVFDSSGNLIGSTINDDGIGSHDRTLMILSVPGIRSFRISSPNEDTFGVDEIQLGVPRVPPVGGELVQPYTLTFPLPWTALAVATTLVTVTLFLGRRRKLI